jgi:hypothetical protein
LAREKEREVPSLLFRKGCTATLFCKSVLRLISAAAADEQNGKVKPVVVVVYPLLIP